MASTARSTDDINTQLLLLVLLRGVGSVGITFGFGFVEQVLVPSSSRSLTLTLTVVTQRKQMMMTPHARNAFHCSGQDQGEKTNTTRRWTAAAPCTNSHIVSAWK